MAMEQLLNKFSKLHKEHKIQNATLIAASGIATINAIKDALEIDNVNLAKVLIAEYERNLSWLLEGDEKNE